MHSFALVFLLLLLVCYSWQIPKFENCTLDIMKMIGSEYCVGVNCFTEVIFEVENCDFVKCLHGSQIDYHNGNDSEEYPNCCSYPICVHY